MNSIPQTIQQMDAISKKTSCFFQRYHVGQILRSANACKLKGFSAILVFLQLVSIIFENRSLYMQRSIHPASVPFGKDTAYRFLNSATQTGAGSRCPWRQESSTTQSGH